MTASGDGTAHIWKAAVVPDRLSHVLGGGSSEESPDSESEDTDAFGKREARSNVVVNTVKVPIIALTGHQGVVSGCQWLNDELCVTSSWDRYVQGLLPPGNYNLLTPTYLLGQLICTTWKAARCSRLWLAMIES